MPQIPFGLSAYSRANGRMAPVRLVNLHSEASPTSSSGNVLFARPGLRAKYGRPIRGIYQEEGVFNGDLFTVSGETLYRDTGEVGPLPGTGRVEFARTVDGLFILSNGIVYQFTGGLDLSVTAFPDAANVSSIAALDNYLYASRRGRGQIYFRVPGDTTWNALDYVSAEQEADQVVGIRSLNGLLYAFGTSSIEPFSPTGSVVTPIQRIQGMLFPKGCKTRDSIAKLDNTLWFVGPDNNAYRIADVPKIVSEEWISERIALSSRVLGGAYTWQGSDYYVIELLTETLAYKVGGGWCQMKLGESPFPSLMYPTDSQVLVGGDKLWTMADVPDDDGVEMERLFSWVIPTDTPGNVDCIEIGLSPGTSPINSEPAVIQTRWSNDQGRTWTDWLEASTGFGGEYRKRVRHRRCGMVDSPGRIGETRITDPVSVRFSDVQLNPPTGGRSRV